jgi:hypothetical protein
MLIFFVRTEINWIPACCSWRNALRVTSGIKTLEPQNSSHNPHKQKSSLCTWPCLYNSVTSGTRRMFSPFSTHIQLCQTTRNSYIWFKIVSNCITMSSSTPLQTGGFHTSHGKKSQCHKMKLKVRQQYSFVWVTPGSDSATSSSNTLSDQHFLP